jgi:hypothetical protein
METVAWRMASQGGELKKAEYLGIARFPPGTTGGGISKETA